MNMTAVCLVPVSYPDLSSHPWVCHTVPHTLMCLTFSTPLCLTNFHLTSKHPIKFQFLCGIYSDIIRLSQVVVS